MADKPRFLKKIDGPGIPIPYTDLLAKRADMIPCDANGETIMAFMEDKQPQAVEMGTFKLEEAEYQVPVPVINYLKTLEGRFLDEALPKQDEEAATEPENETQDKRKRDGIRKEFYNLSHMNFRPWVEKNIQRIQQEPEEVQLEIKAKWRRFYVNDPFPQVNAPA